MTKIKYQKICLSFNLRTFTLIARLRRIFKEDVGEKNEKIKKHDEEKFQEIDRLTERSVLEYDALERKLMNNSRLKKLEDENMELLSKITKLESDSHMAQAKIAEIKNTLRL